MTTTLDNLSGPSPLLGPDESSTADVLPSGTARYLGALTRLCLGWTFLWPFFDKLFGFGHGTTSAKSWLNGGSPTTGFLKGSVGPVAGVYRHLAGSSWADWGFMLGLLCIGVALFLGIGMQIAAVSGAVLLVLMWSASLPPANHLFMDDHIIYALVLLTLAVVGAGNTLGLGHWWTNTQLVRRHGWLT